MKKILKNKTAMFALAVLAIVATYIALTIPVVGAVMLAAFPMVVKIGEHDFTVKSEEEKAQLEQLQKMIEAIAGKSVAGLITAEKAAELIEAKITEKGFRLKDDEAYKELSNAMIEQGKVLKALQEGGTPTDKNGKTLGKAVAEYLTAHKSEFDQMILNKGQIGITLKAAASILNSTHVTGTVPQAYREPGITDYQAERRFLMDVIGWTSTSSPTYEWVEKKNPDGTVVFVLDTEAFAQVDFDLDNNSSTAKDVGAYLTIHENMLNDIDGLAGEIDRELIYLIKKAADGEILAGTGLTSHLKGLTEYASAFALTSINVATPNSWDAISAAIRQVELLGYDTADCIFMNPADYENALGSKDSQGRYVAHPLLSPDGTRFAGIPISTTSFITAGKLLVGNKMKSNIKMYQDIQLAIGYNATGEFAKRHVTVRGSMRLIHFVKDNHTYSWVYDDIADIKNAITLEVA